MSNENSKMLYEGGQTPFPMGALADSGNHILFNSSASLFSEFTGFSPDVRPDGFLTGGAIVPGVSGTDNKIDTDALTAMLAGVNTVASASLDETVTRAVADVASVTSVTLTSAGAIALIQGVDSADATFSEVFGDPGAPPFIPVGSIELGQIRLTTNVAGPITSDEIFQVPGTHMEKSTFPIATADNATATLSFSAALPLRHTGSVVKGVYAKYAEPIFVEQPFSNDFVPSEISHSGSSKQFYGVVKGSSTSSLTQASFTAEFDDGVTDDILSRVDSELWFKYVQDEFKLPHVLTQGKLGLTRTFAADDEPQGSMTITTKFASINKAA